MNYKTGAMKSPKDVRDYQFNAYNQSHKLPDRYERSVPHLRDQGRLGSCVGFASAYIKDEQERRNHPGRNYETSPLFVYHECKKRDGIPNQQGTYPRVAADVVRRLGVCLEDSYPYSDQLPMNPIPSDAKDEAQQFRIKHYTRIHTIDQMKQAVVDHGQVMLGVLVLSSFMQPEIHGRDAFVRTPNGYILGGHAISMIGYDDMKTHQYADGRTHRGMIKIVNSWKRHTYWWGVDGTAWIPYEMLFEDISRDMPGTKLFMEAWAWQDEITPNPAASEIVMWIGRADALVDGKNVQLQQPPKVDPDSWRTLTPLRQTCELLGLNVEWNAEELKITISGEKTIKMWLDAEHALVDGEYVPLQQKPLVDHITHRTLVPLRFVSEILGYKVLWDDAERKITIRRD